MIKRKKRFGKSVANKAPATLIGILEQKCNSLGLPGVMKVPTSLRASQYNHQSGEYISKPLSQRWNDMPDGERIQRDLYSAFLLQHYDPQAGNFDSALLQQDYPQFVQYHHRAIQRLSKASKTLSSMGIQRSLRQCEDNMNRKAGAVRTAKPVNCPSGAADNGDVDRLGSRRVRENSQRRNPCY